MNDLPQSVLKYFWGDKLEELSWEKHKNYISKTLLEKGDKEAVAWLLKKVDKDYLKDIVAIKKIDAKSENFWNIYLSGGTVLSLQIGHRESQDLVFFNQKDFIDIYFLLKEYSLPTLFEKLTKKYLNINYNEPHILKSLVYFIDADLQPSPRMHTEISWEKIKEDIVSKVKDFKL